MKLKVRKGLSVAVAALIAAGALAACGSKSASGSASGKKVVIALSNSFIGNSWRKQMVDSFTQAATAAKKDGRIADFVVTNADGTVQQQISQINGLILRKVNAIVIDSASPTALNGIIAKAVKAGITVVSFDGTVTSTDAYNLNYDFNGLGAHMVSFLANGIGDKGNVMIVRGVAGTVIDQQTYEGTMKELANHSNLKVVSTVYGNWDDATAQSAVSRVLSGLPQISAVIVNGGGYGVAQAFAAAKRPTPLIYLGNRGYELKWWSDQLAKDPYSTESSSTTPSVSTAAFWLALDIVDGAKPKHNLNMDFLTINAKDLPSYSNVPLDQVATKPYDEQFVKTTLLSQ